MSSALPRIIESHWGGTCPLCHCTILPQTRVVYFPPTVVRKGYITHQDGACGMKYTVKVVYAATSKAYVVHAYSATDAMEAARKLVQRDRIQVRAQPISYVAYQGNVQVAVEIIDPALRRYAERNGMVL